MNQNELNHIGVEVTALISMYEGRIISLKEFMDQVAALNAWVTPDSIVGLQDPNIRSTYGKPDLVPLAHEFADNRRRFLERAKQAVATSIIEQEGQAITDMQRVDALSGPIALSNL